MIRLVKLVLLFFIIPVNFLLAQVQFKDSHTKLPIPSVSVFNNNGNLVGVSNKDGILALIPEVKAEGIYPLDLSVQHISYETKSIKVPKNGAEQIVFLELRTNQLKEIVVSIKPAAEFLCIKGYYRSLETFNLKHKYYSDGIVEIYVPLKKGKVKYRLVDCRVFQDSAVTEDYRQKMWTFFQTPRIAEILPGKLIDRMADYTMRKVSDQNYKLLKKEGEVGQIISTQGGPVRFYVDQVLPDTVRLEKVLSIEAKVRHDVYIENYIHSAIEDLTPKDLISVYQLVTGTIKRKAEDGHIPYEVMNEFYVQQNEFLTAKEYQAIEPSLLKNFNKKIDKSEFSRSFWNDLDAYNISPINSGLAAQLNNNLQLVK
jgi:hypothetical protein